MTPVGVKSHRPLVPRPLAYDQGKLDGNRLLGQFLRVTRPDCSYGITNRQVSVPSAAAVRYQSRTMP